MSKPLTSWVKLLGVIFVIGILLWHLGVKMEYNKSTSSGPDSEEEDGNVNTAFTSAQQSAEEIRRLQSLLTTRAHQVKLLEQELHVLRQQQQRQQGLGRERRSSLEGGQNQPITTNKPKYHISSIFSTFGITCQNHGLFLKGYNDPLVVECGAASGAEAAELSHIARVISFEANPANMDQVRRFVGERGVPTRVTAHFGACSNISGNIRLFIPDGSRHSQVASVADQKWWSGNNQSVEVPAFRLSDMVHEHVTMLKLDVQGAEPDVITGAIDLIKNYGIDIIHMEFQPVLQIRNHRDPVRFLELVYDLGFHCFECRFMRRAQSPNRDFHNFTHNNFITPFEPRFNLGIIGGITDMVCLSHWEAPGDTWREKAVPYVVTINNTRGYRRR